MRFTCPAPGIAADWESPCPPKGDLGVAYGQAGTSPGRKVSISAYHGDRSAAGVAPSDGNKQHASNRECTSRRRVYRAFLVFIVPRPLTSLRATRPAGVQDAQPSWRDACGGPSSLASRCE